MDHSAARVARLPAVRAVLVARQRALGDGGGVVMEGRDIGTVVFPNADVKFYLDASAEERARRRAHDESHSGGQQGSVDSLRTDMAARDQSDTTRKVAPLQMAPDAIYVDTTELDVEQVFKVILGRVTDAKQGRPAG